MTEMPLIHEAYKDAIKKEELRLPPDLRKIWFNKSKRKTLTLEESKAIQTRRYLKPPLAPGWWAPAHRLILLAHVNQLLICGAMLQEPCTELRELVKRHRIVELLRGPLQRFSGSTKILLLRSAKTFREKIVCQPTEGIDVAVLRIRAKELARDYSGILRDYGEYRKAALALEPTMRPGEPHDLTSAIMAREKAIASIAVSIDPRLGEIGGLSHKDIEIDGSDVTVVIPAEISKERVSQSRALDSECAMPVIEYVQRAHPFLSAMRPPNVSESGALWLTRTGSPLVQGGVAQALNRVLAEAMGVPVGAKILRKVMASRDDIAENEIGAALGHVLGSLLGIDLYGARDQLKARRQLVAIWDRIDGTIGVQPHE